jgi:hypothetical protein
LAESSNAPKKSGHSPYVLINVRLAARSKMLTQPRANQAAIITPFSAQPHFAEFAALVVRNSRNSLKACF